MMGLQEGPGRIIAGLFPQQSPGSPRITDGETRAPREWTSKLEGLGYGGKRRAFWEHRRPGTALVLGRLPRRATGFMRPRG